MTRDEVIALAEDRKARMDYDKGGSFEWYEFNEDQLADFAAAIEARVKEDIAKVLENYGYEPEGLTGWYDREDAIVMMCQYLRGQPIVI